tara:strand:+ start:171 stop:560 length:390 start_codon:yes stop_codon:yes gene_type:complete
MIDTDKYEGHTEGPWQVVKHTDEWDDEPLVEGVVLIASPNPYPLRVAVCDNRWKMDDNELEERLQHSTTGATAREMFNANEQLIADAPLLLAEVTRLREGIEHALHIRLRHGQEEGWRELKGLMKNEDT